MTTKQKLQIALGATILIGGAVLYSMFAPGPKIAPIPFDSAMWHDDINKRFAMEYPIVVGMSKSEVIKLLGQPDYEANKSAATSEWTATFVYKIPQGASKGARFIDFKDDKVARLGFDDSAEDYYAATNGALK